MEFNFFGPLGPQGAPGSKFAPDLFLGPDVGKGFLCIGVEVENRPKTGPGTPNGFQIELQAGPQGGPGSKFAPDRFLGADVGKGSLCIGVEVENRRKTGRGTRNDF